MLLNEPHWYKDAVIYELHIRAFYDSIGDGVGDFGGLTQKLDYLQDLGVTAIWLLPFYPSPLRDDGYDIADYTSINPHYGNLDQFRAFLNEAHDRGLRVITELVINHTSDQHPWFQRARRAAPGTPERDFYVWSDTQEKYRDARIIFKDFETSNWTYDHVAKAYFWHRFYSHQPDLNFDNPAVFEALLPIVDFWLDMGVDGLRLDAVPYLIEREGTNCENLPETHECLRILRRHVDEKYPHRMLLAEANQWPEDAVAYFGTGDECHMAFHFPVMPRLFMAMHMEDRFPIVDILEQTPPIPEGCQWAMFLRNHDELTLEMVTDEERDYMYRAYAHDRRARVNLGIRRRLAPLLGNNRRRIELMNGLLFSLPGTPVLYYGDEIGMGDNIYLGDRNGVRTPMQWSADRNAGFSRANAQKLYLPIIIDPEYHYEAVNVEAQQNNSSSLLWWMKRLIGHRRKYKALSRGAIQFLQPENRRILAFIRQVEDETLLVVANLSRFVQFVELDLAKHAGVTPVELFGSTEFPRIGNSPYLLTLGPHSFYWFSLSPSAANKPSHGPGHAESLPTVWVSRDWTHLFEDSGATQLAAALRQHLESVPAHGKRRIVRSVQIRETFRVPYAETGAFIVLIDVEYEGGVETQLVSIAHASPDEVAAWPPGGGPELIARLNGATPGLLYDALSIPAFSERILRAISRNSRLQGSEGGELSAWHTSAFAECRGPETEPLPASLTQTEQANESVRYGHRLVLKAYRRIEEGIHPEVELGRLLTENLKLPFVAPFAGAIEYRLRSNEPMTLAVLHGFVPNESDAWHYALDVLSVFFERVASMPPPEAPLVPPLRLKLGEHFREPPVLAGELLHSFLDMVNLLGRRLGELHVALASSSQPEFAPEPISSQYQRSVYQSMRNALAEAVHAVESHAEQFSPEVSAKAQQFIQQQHGILREFQMLASRRIASMRIRLHGDCHLHQVLFTGKDFVFIDFEGEPNNSVGERRIKRSPVRDLITMLRSFDYAAHAALYGLASGRGKATGVIRPEDRPALLPWRDAWRNWTHNAFLQGYLQVCDGTNLLPKNPDERDLLYHVLLLDTLLVEISYEAEHRPAWLEIPLSGLVEVLPAAESTL